MHLQDVHVLMESFTCQGFLKNAVYSVQWIGLMMIRGVVEK